MPILTIFIVLVVVGVCLWAVNAYIPMQAGVKKLLNIVVILILILWLLKEFGIWDYLQSVRV